MYLVVFDEIIDGVKAGHVNEVVLGAASFCLCVYTTMVVLVVPTVCRMEQRREGGREGREGWWEGESIGKCAAL